MLRWRLPTSGEVVALLTVATVAVILLVKGEAMFSPGALKAQSRSGATLGGVTSHAEIGKNCAACHVAPWSSQGMAGLCLDCHADVRRQLEAKGPMHGLLTDGMQCRTCHTEHKGAHAVLTDMKKFDHDCAAFKLTGMHQRVDCRSCHAGNVFKGTSHACVSCHAEPQMHKGRYGTSCASCHVTANWKQTTLNVAGLATFDHDLTGFKLTGKHKAVDCKSCHVNNVFKGTSQACVSCHAEPPVPQVHKASHGTGCASCHSTNTWVGMTHKHTFPLTHHNKGREIACATCHTTANNYHAYTCAGCHEHEPARTARKHAGRGFGDISDCVRCHATGRKNERKRTSVDGAPLGVCMTCPEATSYLLSPDYWQPRSKERLFLEGSLAPASRLQEALLEQANQASPGTRMMRNCASTGRALYEAQADPLSNELIAYQRLRGRPDPWLENVQVLSGAFVGQQARPAGLTVELGPNFPWSRLRSSSP